MIYIVQVVNYGLSALKSTLFADKCMFFKSDA